MRAFGSAWCPVWSLLCTSLQELTADGIRVELVDVDADPIAAERARIVVLPTVLLLRDGSERRRVLGATSAGHVRQLIDR